MILGDIVALAKSGFSMQDIKELMALEEPGKKEAQEEPEDKKLPEEPKKEEDPEDPDYKMLYEESEAKLKEAQKKNVNQPIEVDIKTDEEVLRDLIHKF